MYTYSYDWFVVAFHEQTKINRKSERIYWQIYPTLHNHLFVGSEDKFKFSSVFVIWSDIHHCMQQFPEVPPPLSNEEY